jgi:hypothetical protein
VPLSSTAFINESLRSVLPAMRSLIVSTRPDQENCDYDG